MNIAQESLKKHKAMSNGAEYALTLRVAGRVQGTDIHVGCIDSHSNPNVAVEDCLPLVFHQMAVSAPQHSNGSTAV